MEITSPNKFVSKYEVTGGPIYGLCIWKHTVNNLFELAIYEGEMTWSGRFSSDFAKQYCIHLDEVIAQYHDSVKAALMGDNPSYVYDLVKHDSPTKTTPKSATFTWKKCFEDGTYLVHGSVPLHLDEVPASKSILLDLLIHQNQVLRRSVEDFQSKNEKLIKENESRADELKQFIGVKISLEKSLYGKFIQILNAKKRRIKLLEDHLNDYSSIDCNEVD